MKILSIARRALQFSGYIEFDCRYSSTLNFVQNTLMLSFSVFTLASVTLFVTHLEELKDFLDLFYVNALTYSIIFVHMNLMRQRSKVVKFIDELEEVVNNRAQISLAIREIYAKADASIEKLAKYTVTSLMSLDFVLNVQWIALFILTAISKGKSVDDVPILYPYE